MDKKRIIILRSFLFTSLLFLNSNLAFADTTPASKACNQSESTIWTVVGVLPVGLFFGLFVLFNKVGVNYSFMISIVISAIALLIGIFILGGFTGYINCSQFETNSNQDFGSSTEYQLLSSDNDDQYSNLNQDNPNGWTLLDHNPTTISFTGNLKTIVAHVSFNNMTSQENINLIVSGNEIAQPIQIPAGSTGDFTDGSCYSLSKNDELKYHATGTFDASNRQIHLAVNSTLTTQSC